MFSRPTSTARASCRPGRTGACCSSTTGRVVALPDPIRRPLVALYNRWWLFKARRRRSVENVARVNTREAFEEIYDSDDLRAEYLAAERLKFYDEIAAACAEHSPSRIVD